MYDVSCINKIRAQEIALGIPVGGRNPRRESLESCFTDEILFEIFTDYETGIERYFFPDEIKPIFTTYKNPKTGALKYIFFVKPEELF